MKNQNDYNIEEFPLTPDDSAQQLADEVHEIEMYHRHQQKTIIEVLQYAK